MYCMVAAWTKQTDDDDDDDADDDAVACNDDDEIWNVTSVRHVSL